VDLYSIMCVSDRAKALQWYGVFFGRAADEVIGEEHLWQVGENAWVVVDDREMRAERVGGAMITRPPSRSQEQGRATRTTQPDNIAQCRAVG
jgi:hypothetical protein